MKLFRETLKSITSISVLALILLLTLSLGCLGEPSADAIARIDAINAAIKAKGAKWTAGVTTVTDTPVSQLCGYNELDKSKVQASAMQRGLLNEGKSSLPSTWDWRNVNGHDWTTRVQNQGGCGSCYVFSACGAAEHCMKVQSGPNGWQGNPDFSEQYLMSCAGYGCQGGAPLWVLDYLKREGAPDEACFPYTEYDSTPCSNACPSWEQRITKLHNWIIPEPAGAASVEQIKQAIKDYGAVSAGFAVMTDFGNYTTGVYEYVWGIEEGGHAVTLIGWNDADQCWICKNSWGNG